MELHVSHARSLGGELPARPHSSVRTQSCPCWGVHSQSSVVSPLPWMCLFSCLLLRADIDLPHPPAVGGGQGPFFWEGFLLALFHQRVWNQRGFHSLFSFSPLAEAVLKNKTRPQLFLRRNMLPKIISMGTDPGCPTLVHSRWKPSLPLGPTSRVLLLFPFLIIEIIHGHGIYFRSDRNVLKLDCSDVCMTLWIYLKPVNCTL